MGSMIRGEFFDKGVQAMENRQYHLARACFEKANSFYRCPSSCSYLAFCLAKSRGRFTEAVALAQDAIAVEPDNAVHYLHLGRVYLLMGEKKKGIETLRHGRKIGCREEIDEELRRLGIRRQPPFPFLARSNFLNRMSGFIMSRLTSR